MKIVPTFEYIRLATMQNNLCVAHYCHGQGGRAWCTLYLMQKIFWLQYVCCESDPSVESVVSFKVPWGKCERKIRCITMHEKVFQLALA